MFRSFWSHDVVRGTVQFVSEFEFVVIFGTVLWVTNRNEIDQKRALATLAFGARPSARAARARFWSVSSLLMTRRAGPKTPKMNSGLTIRTAP